MHFLQPGDQLQQAPGHLLGLRVGSPMAIDPQQGQEGVLDPDVQPLPLQEQPFLEGMGAMEVEIRQQRPSIKRRDLLQPIPA